MKGPIAPPVAQSPLSLRKLFRWSTQAISGIAGPFYLITFLTLLTNLVALYNAQLITNFIAQVQRGGTKKASEGFSLIDAILPNDIGATAILFAITALLLIGLGFANRVGTVWINTLMLRGLQLRLHDKLMRLGPNYHGRHDMGENQAVIMQYSQQAQGTLRDALASPVVRSVSLISAIWLLFYNLSQLEGQDNVVYSILAVLLIVLPVGGWWLSNRIRAANLLLREQQSAVANTLVDSLTAPQEIQLMNAGPLRAQTFAARLKMQAEVQLRAAIQNETSNQFQAAVPALLQVGLILWAVFAVGGTAAVQAAVAIYLFVPRVTQPIQEAITFYTGINNAWPAIEKIGSLLEEPLEVEDTGKRTTADLRSHDIALENLTYQPIPDRKIIDNVSFRFAEGKITALVGLSGSGKSTILKLISRLFDPNAGRVTIGGTDIREMQLPALRSSMASVSQFPLFIEADVRENMRLGAPGATDTAMEAACRAADIWPALERVSPSDPLGAPVPRMAGKAGLSGGERRRLAIARALLTEPRILLLDEPAAGIDVLSVTKIADELRRVAPGRTILLVEHNIPLISSVADIVCCVEDGRITDVGTPAELSARPTLFKRLMDTQLAYGDQVEYDVKAAVPVRPIEVPAAPHGAVKGPPPGGMGRAAQAGAQKGLAGAPKGMKQPA